MFNEEKRCKILLGVMIAIIVVTSLAILFTISPNKNDQADANVVETTTEEVTVVITESTTNETSTANTTTSTTSMTTTESTTTTGMTTGETTTVTSVEETTVEVTDEVVVNDEHVELRPIMIPQARDTEPVITPETTTVVTTTETTTVEETTTTTETTLVETVEEESSEEEETVANETYLGNFRITGYVAGPGAKTASGTTPNSSRTIAMNKTQFKNLGLEYGDKIRVDGIGTFILEDCGCASGRIDIFRDSVAACYALTSYADAYLVNE